MKRLAWFSGLLAAFLAAGQLAFAQVGAPVAGANGPLSGTYTQAQQLTSGQALRTPVLLFKSTIPIVVLSSGSMGNNGAITALTALSLTYANAYCVLPAGAIAAGVPAATATYYCQFSSTTAATVCNNLMSANLDATGAPTVPASCTAFSTTGPGAFTGITANVDALTATVPANALGARGLLHLEMDYAYTNSAGQKQMFAIFGGTNVLGVSATTSVAPKVAVDVVNRGVTNVQLATATFTTTTSGTSLTPLLSAIDTTAAVNLVFRVNHNGAAVDNIVIEQVRGFITSDGT